MRVLPVVFIVTLLFASAAAYGQGACIPPSIQTQPQGGNITPGDTVTLMVTATGTAPLTYKWFQQPDFAAPIPVGGNASQFTTPPLTGTTSYYVIISNACGSAASNIVVLSYSGPTHPPSVYSIANAASSSISGQNGFGIAQGSMFVIYGSSLGPADLVQANSFPIPTVLNGTSVQIVIGASTFQAPMIYTSSAQVAAILPSSVPSGDGMLTVTYNGNSSFAAPIHVVNSGFGVFTLTSDGAGTGVIYDATGRLPTFAQPVHSGDTVVLWGTGLGPIPGIDAGTEASQPLPGNRFTPDVFVGDQPATLQYAGRSGCCAALDQIVFQIPQNVQGCFVPLAVRTGGIVSNFVSFPIGAPGQPCSDPVGISPDLLTKAGSASGASLGIIAMGPIPVLQSAGFAFTDALAQRLSLLLGTKVTAQDLQMLLRASRTRRSRAWKVAMKKYAPLLRARNIDPSSLLNMANALNYQGVTAGFRNLADTPAFSTQYVSAFPPPGTCIAGDNGPALQSFGSGAASFARDAGAQLLLTGPSGTQTLNRLPNGEYQLPLAGTSFGLPPGAYSISSNGGRDIGAFTASVQVGSPLTWSNKSSVGFIDRSQPLTITWTGGPSSGYVVFGGAASGDGVQAAFTCVEDAGKQTLTVPDFVLSAMPHTSSDHGSVFLIAHPLENLFTAPGIDIGFFANLTSDSKEIAFQ